MEAAKAKGATVRIGKVEGMRVDGDRVTGVVVDGETIYADAVVIAMGPWSCMAEDWFEGLSLPMQVCVYDMCLTACVYIDMVEDWFEGLCRYVNLWAHVCIHVCIFICLYIYIYIYIYVYVYVYVYIHG